MTTLRPFTCNDLFKFNVVNLDPLTETYGLSFYMQYLAHWPEFFQVAESPNGDIMGYEMFLDVGFCPTGISYRSPKYQKQNTWSVPLNRKRPTNSYILAHPALFLVNEPTSLSSAFIPTLLSWDDREHHPPTAHSAVMGKAEGQGEDWHSHVTALTVGPEYRRLGVAATLMAFIEDVSEKKRAYFVDLFVRVSNRVAINMYKRLGYIVYRTVLEYYSGDPDENAYDMRKACSRDVDKLSVIPLTHPVHPEDVD